MSAGGWDAFVVKFNTNGIRLWATYYGGPQGNDAGTSCSTDATGNVYLGGWTMSSTGIASGGHQNTKGGMLEDAFLVKFDAAGVRQWATYYGGADPDFSDGCTTDASGNVYLAGTTESKTNIASGGHQNTYSDSTDAFLVKFNASGVRQWASYYGGTRFDKAYSCATDASGNIYMSGMTGSKNNIAAGGIQNTLAGVAWDAYLVKFNSNGIRQCATYYGGTGDDQGFTCTTDASGNVYLGGLTLSAMGIAKVGFQNTYGGTQDGFLLKMEGSCIFTGISEWHDEEQLFSILPNPNTGFFTLRLKNETHAEMVIYNLLGDVVKKAVIKDQNSIIELTGKTNGVYFIEIKQDQHVNRLKMIKY